MDNNHSSKDRLGTNEFDVLVTNGSLCISRGVRLDVSEITDVANFAVGTTMGFIVGIEVRACVSRVSREEFLPAETHPLVLSPKALNVRCESYNV